MLLIFWLSILTISVIALVKGADLLIESSEEIGLSLGLPAFLVGALVVGGGTSLPELVSGITAVNQGDTNYVITAVIGANIANVLFLLSIALVAHRRLHVTKDMISVELPLFITVCVLFLGVTYDRVVTGGEGVFLLAGYMVYFLHYVVSHQESKKRGVRQAVPPLASSEWLRMSGIFAIGFVCLFFGAQYLIQAVHNLNNMVRVSPTLLTFGVVALGTSLPEFFVSWRAAHQGKSDIALGNVFGSNVFNMLIVTGVPSLFHFLSIDDLTYATGIPVFITISFAFLLFITLHGPKISMPVLTARRNTKIALKKATLVQ